MSPREHCPGARSCAESAPRWRCRCSNRWSRRSPRWPRRRPTPPKRFGAVYFPNGATMKHWMPETTGAGFEFKTILKPLEPFRDRRESVRQSVEGRWQVGDRSRGQLRRLAERSGRQADRGRGHPGRHQHRSGHCQADRSGHAASVDGGCHRGLQRLRRRLRARLCLRLHEHDLLGVGDAVEPDGDQPAHGVRTDVRPRRDDGRARGADERGSQHPRFDHRRSARPAAQGRRARPFADRRLPRSRSRDRAPHPADRSAELEARADARRAPGRAGHVREPRGADVRSARRGVSVRHHARLLVHDVARGEPADLPRAQHSR